MKMKKYFLKDNTWDAINCDLGDQGGVYILKCNGEDDQPVPVSRVLDIDLDGVLYIGMATKFKNRAIKLKHSLSPEYNNKAHDCGVLYKTDPRFSERFPFDCLYFELHQCEEPGQLEGQLLKEYRQKYGEVPPFNSTT